MMNSSYRPHNPGHNYYAPGIYLVTLVVGHREHLLGTLNMDACSPGVLLSDIGQLMKAQWEKTPALQAKHGNKVVLHNQAVMPDHWHGVIEIVERSSWSLGDIIQAVKASLTSRWRKLNGYQEQRYIAERIRNMTHEERREYYATRPRHEQPLFDDEYDDTICLRNSDGTYDKRHLSAMLNYVLDNPRRAIMLKNHPDFMQRRLHLVIGGRDYSAFGNLFLLRLARKEQVFCHRYARLSQLTSEERNRHGYTYQASPDLTTSVPYQETQSFQQEQDEFIRKVMEGQTVLVTPGISEGEKRIKNLALQQGFPLIHIQKDSITQFWKPEHQRFEACLRGSFLILAPWNPENLGDNNGIPSTTNYAIFHNLNDVARDICQFEGEARVMA